MQFQRYAWFGAILLMLFIALFGGTASAQSDPRCFPATGQCIAGPIRAYWERNGGLAIFGYPISPLQSETMEGQMLPVQWFERDRLEDHGSVGVLAGRLGARFLELSNSPWESFPTINWDKPAIGCTFFAQTAHSLCEPYLSYWRNNGDLERFGYPITQPFYETLEGHKYEVQYFERRRMELHSGLPGSPILLGLLGRAVRDAPEPTLRYPDCLTNGLPSLRNVTIGKPIGCPTSAPLQGVPAATQTFEHGVMIWTDTRTISRPRFAPNVPAIFALINPGPAMQPFDDMWSEGQPDTPSDPPPGPGLYAPYRGFGTAWASNTPVRVGIGWATEPRAQARTADIQLFDKVLLLRINETGVVYAFGNTNTSTDAQIVAP